MKAKEKWLSEETSRTGTIRKRAAKFDDLEKCLFEWANQIINKNGTLTDEILKEKAKFFGTELGVIDDEFSYSNGWLTRFKSRFKISSHKVTGESRGADMRAVVLGRETLPTLLADYTPEQIYNYDETGLMTRAPPDKTLSVGAVKKQKERLTVGLCCNSDGSHKFKPLVIG